MEPAPLPLHEAVAAFKRKLALEVLARFCENRSRAAAARAAQRGGFPRAAADQLGALHQARDRDLGGARNDQEMRRVTPKLEQSIKRAPRQPTPEPR